MEFGLRAVRIVWGASVENNVYTLWNVWYNVIGMLAFAWSSCSCRYQGTSRWGAGTFTRTSVVLAKSQELADRSILTNNARTNNVATYTVPARRPASIGNNHIAFLAQLVERG